MMRGSEAIGTDPFSPELLRQVGKLCGSPGDGNLSNALAVLGGLGRVWSALWLCDAEGARLVATHPEDLNARGWADWVVDWADSLQAPIARDAARLREGPQLSEEPAWQSIVPLDLSETERAVWVVESDAELPDLTAIAELLRLGLTVRRKHAQQDERIEKLRSQQALMERIVDALPVGLYVVDQHYRIVAWNRKRETGTQGVAREDAIGRSVFEVLYRQPEDRLRQELEDVFESGEMRHYEVESTASGEPRYYRLTKVPMRLGVGDEVTHVITIGEDITERKRISERISHAEKLAALGQMAAGVMHEINNPLATIAACAEALEESVESESEEFGLISMIDTEVDRCKRIARDLLAFSRPPPSEKGPVDVQDAVEETLKLLRHHDRFKKIRVQREYVYNLPLVWANSERLIQVFVALALNALDAMEDDGELRVRTEVVGENEVGVSFIDTGCGIPASELSKIFEPFYTSKAPGKGTGLGLSICYGIIAEHGGRIEVDSAVEMGSNFRVVLPSVPTEDFGEEEQGGNGSTGNGE